MIDDEIRQREAQIRAEKAKAILESTAWQEAWDGLQRLCFEQFTNAASTDKDMLVHWKLTLANANRVKDYFEQSIKEGKLASANLEFQKRGVLTFFRK